MKTTNRKRKQMTEKEVRILTRKEEKILENHEERRFIAVVAAIVVLVIGLLIAVMMSLVIGWRLVSAKVSLTQAESTKKIQIEEARATRDSASLLADAEIERARGVAEANRIIADTLTPEYIRWLYVDQLDQTQGTIIYVPTEAGIPILEAGRTGADNAEG